MLRIPLVTLSLLTALAASACAAERSSFPREVMAASGVATAQVERYALVLDRLAAEFSSPADTMGDTRKRAQAIHAFLHERVLHGKYRADASNLGVALDGGAYNCAAVTALFLVLADRAGLTACAVSTPGHVWCRVTGAGEELDVETTCRDWFAIRDRYRGLPDEEVSTAMAAHRRRVAVGRALSRRELLAVFHFNRGVTFLRRPPRRSAAGQPAGPGARSALSPGVRKLRRRRRPLVDADGARANARPRVPAAGLPGVGRPNGFAGELANRREKPASAHRFFDNRWKVT